MTEYLSINDISEFLVRENYKLTRPGILRYLKMGLCSSSISEFTNTYGINSTKKYYHPVTILEAMTAYNLFRGEMLYLEDNKLKAFNIGHEVDRDVFIGRLAFLSSSGTIKALNSILYFSDYVINLLHTQLPAEAAALYAKYTGMDNHSYTLKLKKPSNSRTRKPWELNLKDFFQTTLIATTGEYEKDVPKVDDSDIFRPIYKDNQNTPLSIINIEILLQILLKSCFVELNAKLGTEKALLFLEYQRMIYSNTFITLSKYYSPLISEQLFNCAYQSPFFGNRDK